MAHDLSLLWKKALNNNRMYIKNTHLQYDGQAACSRWLRKHTIVWMWQSFTAEITEKKLLKDKNKNNYIQVKTSGFETNTACHPTP